MNYFAKKQIIRGILTGTKQLIEKKSIADAVEFFETHRCENDIEMRICYETGKFLLDGVCVDGGEAYYDRWEYFHKNYPNYGEVDDDDDTYYTTWEDDHNIVNEVHFELYGCKIPLSDASEGK